MSAWPGKFVIGLTGNIATGKSVVRKMLEHLGAYGIDADALSHRAIAKDAPGYKPVLDLFGRWILGADDQIDRAKLSRVVFSDPGALKQLESIVHPLVRQATDVLVKRSQERVIVMEAIKLIESPLRQACDSVWVTYAPPEIQLARLMSKRGMSEDAARQRITVQDSQDSKVAVANFVIRNEGSFDETWKQVNAAWLQLFPAVAADTTPTRPVTAALSTAQAPAAPKGEITVEKALPKHSAEIAAFVTRITNGARKLTVDNVMEAFGEKAFICLRLDGKLVCLVGWRVENLVARTNDVYMELNLPLEPTMRALMEYVENTSRDLQCESHLLFLPPVMARHEQIWRGLGYELRSIENLGVRAWQEAAQESLGKGEVMLFKQLRKDRVLRPV